MALRNYKEHICPYCNRPFYSKGTKVLYCKSPECVRAYRRDKSRKYRETHAEVNAEKPAESLIATENRKARELGLSYGYYKGLQMIGVI